MQATKLFIDIKRVWKVRELVINSKLFKIYRVAISGDLCKWSAVHVKEDGGKTKNCTAEEKFQCSRTS